MEKALEIIKEHIKDLERMVDVFSFYGCFSSAAECKKANKELNEAIAELEEAMKQNTCEGCKYQNIDIDRCDFCKRYYSDQYEPKE